MPQKQVIGPALAKELEAYKGRWVAIEDQHVVASSDSTTDILRKAREKGFDNPLLFHVPALERGQALIL